jgi:hypothetical protein
VSCFIVSLLRYFLSRAQKIYKTRSIGQAGLAGYKNTMAQGGQMGGVQEDAGGQLPCILLRVDKREKTQVENEEWRKGDYCSWKKSG